MVHVFAGNLPALLCTVLAKGDQLVLGVLAPILGADAGVQCDSIDPCYAFHGVSSVSLSGLFETDIYPRKVAMFSAFKLPALNMLFDTPSPKCECCPPASLQTQRFFEPPLRSSERDKVSNADDTLMWIASGSPTFRTELPKPLRRLGR